MSRIYLLAVLSVLVPAVTFAQAPDPPLPGEVAYQNARKLEYGQGVVIDKPSAVQAYREAAAAGHPLAMARLASYYSIGLIVEVNQPEAKRLVGKAMPGLRRAADGGRADAQYILGALYADGRGVARDQAEAVRWYRKAAEQNDPIAQDKLGFMYSFGNGVEKDRVEAVRWYRKAADQNLAVAQHDLGFMYEEGWGVEKDKAEAARWYQKAADQGYELARIALKQLGKKP